MFGIHDYHYERYAGGLVEHLPSVIVYSISNSVLTEFIHPHMTMLFLNTELLQLNIE